MPQLFLAKWVIEHSDVAFHAALGGIALAAVRGLLGAVKRYGPQDPEQK